MISLFWAPADSMNSVQEMRFEFPSNLIGHGKSTMVVVVVVFFFKKKKKKPAHDSPRADVSYFLCFPFPRVPERK